MNNENVGRSELISALVDGELEVAEFTAVVESVASTREGLVTWQAYHLVGDALRGSAHASALGADEFVAQLRSRMAAQGVQQQWPLVTEPTMAVVPAVAMRESSNDPVMRWKLVAGFASLAAVVTFGWHVATLHAGASNLVQESSAPLVQVTSTGPVITGERRAESANSGTVMLRDARLDELLAAHKQFGGTSALQMPAGFLRNATFDGSGR